MKIALYIAEGYEQIVLTPQTPTETSLLGKLHDATRGVEIKRGSFYHCMAGFLRHGDSDSSTILVISDRAAP